MQGGTITVCNGVKEAEDRSPPFLLRNASAPSRKATRLEIIITADTDRFVNIDAVGRVILFAYFD